MSRTRRVLSLAALLVATLPALGHAQSPKPLRVVRVTPDGDASPMAAITVTFDRPVAGSLDRSVDATTVLRVEPGIGGKAEWRDPMTIRLVPSPALTPGARYTVIVANNFRAMDGSALPEPHRFTFRVQGPTLIGGLPVGPDVRPPEHLTPRQRFTLVYSAPVDLARLSSAAYLEFRADCAPQRIIRLQATTQRRIASDDHHSIEEAGGWRRERAADSLRRVVQLVPASELPLGCPGELVAPSELDDPGSPKYTRMAFTTYGQFQLKGIDCHGTQRGPRQHAFCPTGPLAVTFTNPVRGSEVLRRLRLVPDAKFTIADTAAESMIWTLEATLKPHVGYAIVADTAMRDIFGQSLRGNPALGYRTTGYAPAIKHPFGRLLVERVGFRTLAVEHVNVDTLVATIAPIPESLEAKMLGRFAWAEEDSWPTLERGATVQRLPIRAAADRPMVTGVRFTAPDASRPGTPTLFAVKVNGRSSAGDASGQGPTALVQVTDLGVHARIGVSEAAIWVTGVSDGTPKQGATVILHDAQGRRLASAVTDARGLARLAGWPVPPATEDDEGHGSFEGYVSVTLGGDRAITAINRWDPDLSPWRFNVASAWGEDRLPLAGAVFTERGIYRPGERVYAKAIIRDGSLGALRVPAAGDSIKWIFHDREEGTLREVTTRLSSFGTADQSLALPTGVAIGDYSLSIQSKRRGKWRTVGRTSYRVAEYRPPEFLVDLSAERAPRFPGQAIATTAQARYLFGARMGRAQIAWQARQVSVGPWEIEIPGVDGWYVGSTGNWWEWDDPERADVFASKIDTLDARGEGAFSVTVPESPKGRPMRVTVEASVTDINRQVVGASTTTLVHPAEFYIAAKPAGESYFWRVGTPQPINVLAVRPDGQKVSGVRVQGTIVRMEWHRVRRERDGVSALVGEWVQDTVARCTVTTAESPVPCAFTPSAGGEYTVALAATDRAGRAVKTSFYRWAAGPGWVPWSDETQFKMDVIPDRTRYAVGDTATVMLASPFTNAEAWITVEREGLIEQRRMRLASGATTIKIPITEAHAPNAFVSVLVARGRSAPPGSLDDDGRPTIRVGYTELRVTPEVKRLTVALEPEKTEYRPADTARVRIRVRDSRGSGPRSEVTLWAVDEGVLALTDYKTPDPIDLIYRARGLGMRLASNMTSVAPQVPEGEKGRREAGGGGGASGADILRSRFQTTAFFLGSVVTDAQGNAVATAKLPDNITTFRIMALAVTAGDRYGKGETPMLVTRPLLARQALPRFVRSGDSFTAGAVVNRRDGAQVGVKVKAEATGVTLRGRAEQSATLAASKGAEVRFPFVAARMSADSAAFRFDVADGRDADAVRVAIPVKPDHHPVGHTIAGVLRDTASVEMLLPANIDPERSRLSLHVGVSPLVAVKGMYRWLRIYPYYCSEQVISTAIPLIALYRAQQLTDEKVVGDPKREIARAVDVLTSRVRADGGIGYWSSGSWSSSWLSAYAGMVLLDARDLGVKVDQAVLEKLADYVTRDLRGALEPTFTPLVGWYTRPEMRLADQVAALDFLSRFGRPDVAAENETMRAAGLLALEDRARFAEVLARRGQTAAARRLMEPTWALVRMEGSRAVLPADSVRGDFYFQSRMRPIARILSATLAIAPDHPLVSPLAEALAQHGRAAGASWVWNTQDYASSVSALAELDRRRRAQGDRSVRVRAGRRVLLEGATGNGRVGRDSSVALAGLLSRADGGQALRLSIDAGAGTGNAPVYYYLTVTEVPSSAPTSIEDRGIRVERWYETFPGGKPTTTAVEGDLVRVRLKITVPSTRYFVVLDDALPGGLEAVDLSLRTASAMPGPGAQMTASETPDEERTEADQWGYGSWDGGWWSPFDHREIRDDRVVYSATVLWPGTYTATYIARATTPGTFTRPPAHAEEMYNPAVNGRSDGGTMTITAKEK